MDAKRIISTIGQIIHARRIECLLIFIFGRVFWEPRQHSVPIWRSYWSLFRQLYSWLAGSWPFTNSMIFIAGCRLRRRLSMLLWCWWLWSDRFWDSLYPKFQVNLPNLPFGLPQFMLVSALSLFCWEYLWFWGPINWYRKQCASRITNCSCGLPRLFTCWPLWSASLFTSWHMCSFYNR